MNDVLRPFLRHFVLVFFDDILIYSVSWAEHLQHVHAVFQELRTHRLALKQRKCSFGAPEVAYLGHIISSNDVDMDPSKVEVVLSWPTPTSVRALRGFLGLIGTNRNSSGTTAWRGPSLNSSSARHFPGPPRRSCVHNAQGGADDGTNTAAARLHRPVIVNCDAFGSGFGAVLHHDAGPIAYYSRPVAPQHAKLAAYEHKLIGLVKAVRH
jgi:hypothetical protein